MEDSQACLVTLNWRRFPSHLFTVFRAELGPVRAGSVLTDVAVVTGW